MCPYIQITLPSYGVLAFIGAFAALLFLYFRLDRFDIAFTQFLKLVALCAVGCVLGSKLMYALTQIPWLIENFSAKNLLMLIPNSGYVFYGGLLGMILAIYLYAKKARLTEAGSTAWSSLHSRCFMGLDVSAVLWPGAAMVSNLPPPQSYSVSLR